MKIKLKTDEHHATDTPIYWIETDVGRFELEKSVKWIDSVRIYDERNGAFDYSCKLAKATALTPSDMDGKYKIIRDFSNRNYYGFCEGRTTYKYALVENDRDGWETIHEFSIINGVVK